MIQKNLILLDQIGFGPVSKAKLYLKMVVMIAAHMLFHITIFIIIVGAKNIFLSIELEA